MKSLTNSQTCLTTEKQIENEEDHDPLENRDTNGNSTLGTFAHLLKGFLGSGILAMPLAFKNSGLLFGGIGTVIVGFLCGHCVHILVNTSQKVCKKVAKPALGFAETAEAVFANGPICLRNWSNVARNFVDCSLIATYWAASCVYIVFIATSIHDVINYDLDLNWDKRLYIGMITIFIVLVGQIRNLKVLIPFSVTANIFIVITFGITLYYMFSEPLNFTDKPLYAGYRNLPMFFSTVIFAMEGIGIVMPIENQMRNPKHFLGCPSVLTTVMLIVTTLFLVIGLFGYVRYGDKVEGSITLNLPDGVPLADTAKILMALSIFCTYPLQMYVPNGIFWKKIETKFSQSQHNIAQIVMRATVSLVTCGITAGVPNLEPVIGLVGSIFFSILGIFIPSFIETVYRWESLGLLKWILFKNIFLMVFSIFALVTGSYISIEQIIKDG